MCSQWFLPRISTNLSDLLGFDSWPYPKLFMSLMQMNDYIYVVIDDYKVSNASSYTTKVCGVAWHPTSWQLDFWLS